MTAANIACDLKTVLWLHVLMLLLPFEGTTEVVRTDIFRVFLKSWLGWYVEQIQLS